METVGKNNSDVQEQGPKKGIVIIVITILLGTNALLLWQFFDKKSNLDMANQTIVTTTAERDALQIQLNQVKGDYEKAKNENVDLHNQLSSKDEEIKAKVAKIQQLIALGGPAQIAKAKAELAKLKEMNAVYIYQVDSLSKANNALQAANMGLNSDLESEKSKNQNLASQNSRLADKVNAGSILIATNVVTGGSRNKSNGKQSPTNKAKQVQQITTTFTLLENRVIDKGNVDIYIRLIGPSGDVESSNQDTFMAGGQSLVYTVKESIDYNNQDTPVTIALAKGTQFVKGKYNIEIYHSGEKIGKSTIDLK
jgi:hypothetical protein